MKNLTELVFILDRSGSMGGLESDTIGGFISMLAGRFGVSRNCAQNFHNDSEGIALNYSVVSDTVSLFRAAPPNARIDDNWGADIQADYKKRKGGKK